MSDNATKGAEVEEWLDLHFFRPVGARLARALFPTRISPDAVTLWSLGVGLVAGHLFLYSSVWLSALGFALFIVSDIFDSADGQLARMRGTSTRFGRILDGISDNARFFNLYLTLLARLVLSGWYWSAALPLVLAAGISHSWQSAAVDFVRNAYLRLANARGELDLAEDVAMPERGFFPRLAARLYRAYVSRQERLFPRTAALVRSLRAVDAVPAKLATQYRERHRALLGPCAWIGQNIRWLLIGAAGIAGWPSAFLWATLVPLNLVLVAIVTLHERRTAAVLASLPSQFSEPAHSV